MPPSLASDLAYCRAILPRVSRTFALNIRLLRGGLGEAVRIAYLLCRTADAVEDSWPGDGRAIEDRFALLLEALGGDAAAAEEFARRAAAAGPRGPELELAAQLPRVRRAFGSLEPADREAVATGVTTLARGMCRYAARSAERAGAGPYLDTEDELHDYCWVVAGCVGEMLTRLFGPRMLEAGGALAERRLALAPAVGEALQLTNILLDWPADVRRGRCYLPAAWLSEHHLTAADLVGGNRPGVAALAARLEDLARAALAQVPDYLDTIPSRHVRIRLFCLWPALWALQSLRHARRDPEFPWGARRPRLPRGELWGSAVGSLLASHHRLSLRRLYAASG